MYWSEHEEVKRGWLEVKSPYILHQLTPVCLWCRGFPGVRTFWLAIEHFIPHVKLTPQRAECLRVFTLPLYLIDQLRWLIRKELPSPGCLGLNWKEKNKTCRHSALYGMSLIRTLCQSTAWADLGWAWLVQFDNKRAQCWFRLACLLSISRRQKQGVATKRWTTPLSGHTPASLYLLKKTFLFTQTSDYWVSSLQQ